MLYQAPHQRAPENLDFLGVCEREEDVNGIQIRDVADFQVDVDIGRILRSVFEQVLVPTPTLERR